VGPGAIGVRDCGKLVLSALTELVEVLAARVGAEGAEAA
jgi:hypothetical protein